MSTLLQQANEALKALTEQVNPQYKPRCHITPSAGWMNDPNGLIYFNGQYHAFYQHYPYNENWGPMHWGHAVSDDLVHWRHCPIALAPDQDYDRDGCFSGSAVDNQGVLSLIYTGHVWLKAPGDDSAICEVQCLATSDDGINFVKHGPVLEAPEGIMHFRDPKVWSDNGVWNMVIGARDASDVGQVLLYQSDDLKNWRFIQVVDKAGADEGYMWECPDLFELGGKQVLMFSPQGIAADGYHYRNRFQSGYILADKTSDSLFERSQPFKELDAGHDFYAPQSFTAKDGRRIIFGWMDMWESPMPCKEDKWAGSLTLPRVLTLTDRQEMLMNPVEEIINLRQDKYEIDGQSLTSSRKSLGITAKQTEIIIELDLNSSSAERFGLELAATSDGQEGTLLYVDGQSKRLVLDRSRGGLALSGYRSVALPDADRLKLRIFIDHSCLEVFVNDGQACFSSRIYPKNGEYGVNLFADNGSAVFGALSYWQLNSIYA